MAAATDYAVTADNEIKIVDNDFQIVLSDEQHIQDTIQSYPLYWKQYPTDGVGIQSYVGSTGQIQKLMGEIKKQLQNDGYLCNNPKVTINQDTVTYNPNAIRL